MKEHLPKWERGDSIKSIYALAKTALKEAKDRILEGLDSAMDVFGDDDET